jgi:hypothetical protein
MRNAVGKEEAEVHAVAHALVLALDAHLAKPPKLSANITLNGILLFMAENIATISLMTDTNPDTVLLNCMGAIRENALRIIQKMKEQNEDGPKNKKDIN